MEFRVMDLMIDALPAKKSGSKKQRTCEFPPPCKSRTNAPTRCRPGTSTNACVKGQKKAAIYDALLEELRENLASGKTLES